MGKSRRRSSGSVLKLARLASKRYTLDVYLDDGPITQQFAEANDDVSRVIQIRGDQTLDQLHDIIFRAFDRFDPHLYEFQVGGKGPFDPKSKRFGPSLPDLMKFDNELTTEDAGGRKGDITDFLRRRIRDITEESNSIRPHDIGVRSLEKVRRSAQVGKSR